MRLAQSLLRTKRNRTRISTRIFSRLNSVYAWGNAADGRLGLGDRVDEELHTVGFAVYHPRRLENFSQSEVVKVNCGSAHTIFLNADGEVFTCGRGSNGQLGHGNSTDCYTPQRVEGIPGHCVDIAAGYLHSLAVTSEGDVYSFGQARNGQLGQGEPLIDIATPKKIPSFTTNGERIKSLHAGDYFSVAASEEGRLYTFGLAEDGRLGLPDSSPRRAIERTDDTLRVRVPIPTIQSRIRGTPGLVGPLGAMDHVFCSPVGTIALSRYGNAFGWGCGENYTFGNGSDGDLDSPEELEYLSNLALQKISSSATHSLALNSEGQLIVWGTNESGCLGYGGNASGYPIVLEHTSSGNKWLLRVQLDNEDAEQISAETFQDICAGFRFSIAVRSDGAVYSWGNGDSGALGVGLGVDYWTPKPVRQFTCEEDGEFAPQDFRASRVACGFNHVVALA